VVAVSFDRDRPPRVGIGIAQYVGDAGLFAAAD